MIFNLYSKYSYIYINCFDVVADAWGKLPSGILSGHIMELGNYDQCLAVRKELEPNNTFEGQFCVSYVTAQVNKSNIPEDALPYARHNNVQVQPTNVRFLPIPAAR